MKEFERIEIRYKDERGASHLVSFNDCRQEICKYQLDKIFFPATLIAYDENGHGYAAGGVRPCEEHEKKRRNHKWFRWIDFNDPKPLKKDVKVEELENDFDFMEELKKLSYSKSV